MRSSCGDLGQRTASVAGSDAQQHVEQRRVAASPGARLGAFPCSVGAWGDRQTQFGELAADRLDPTPGGALLIDERADQRRRGLIPGQENRGGLQDFVGLGEVSDLRLQSFDLRPAPHSKGRARSRRRPGPAQSTCAASRTRPPSFGPRAWAAPRRGVVSSRSRAIRRARSR